MTTVEQTDGVRADNLDSLDPPASRLRSEAGARLVWWLLGVWFVANLVACGMFADWIQPLGWGSLVYLIFGGPVVVAEFGLAAIWMWLGDDTRLARFADLPLGMALLAIAFSLALGDGLSFCWPLLQLVTVVSLPLVPLWMRGLRITRRRSVDGGRVVWCRFGIADLLVGTTCLAALLGIVHAGQTPVQDAMWFVLLASPAWLVTLLGFRGKLGHWTLWAVCLAFGVFVALVLFTEMIGATLLPNWFGFDVRLWLVLTGMQLLPLAIVVAMLRRLGYRLRAVG